jgi:lipid-A-disaccharide synthase
VGRPGGELRRTLAVLAMAGGALLAFLPFLLNLVLSVVLGGRYRKRVRRHLVEAAPSVNDAERASSRGRVYLLAGEDSGDLHAANLVASLREEAPEARTRGMGGPRMEKAGCELDFDLVRMNVMGVLPVIRSVPTFFRIFRDLLRMLDTDPPDVLVPVDYPGFNLRAARAARKRGVKVVYYIAPQIWAWAPWRLRRISRSVDRMLVILPFERELYRDGGVQCSFVGHPLYEHLEREAHRREDDDRPDRPKRIGLLPGSRRSEVRGVLPMMLRAAERIRTERPEVELVLPYRGASLRAEIERIVEAEGAELPLELVEGRTHEVMRDLDLALVASGTATLELAYYGVPMVVLYRVGRIAGVLKRILLIVPQVALVNIVAGRRVVPEFVGAGDYSERAAGVLLGWLRDPDGWREVQNALAGVRSRLLFTGVSRRAARWILSELPVRGPDRPREESPHGSPRAGD